MLESKLLREERLIVGFLVQPRNYPPGPFSRGLLAMLYSKITERYNYPNFNQLPNGAVMLQPATKSHVQLQELLIQVNEEIEVHFPNPISCSTNSGTPSPAFFLIIVRFFIPLTFSAFGSIRYFGVSSET